MAATQHPKHSELRLSANFASREYDCPCMFCQATLIDPELVEKVQALRYLAHVTLTISSGYRCADHQKELTKLGYETAKGISQHQLGRAVDIRSQDLSGEELERLARAVGFKAVGVAHNWIHVDLRSDRDRRWTYRR